MSIKNTTKFLLGAAIFSPLLATEDVLRYFKAPISKHGLFKNDEGKGILQIWNECAPEPKLTAKVLDIGGKGTKIDLRSLEGVIIPEGM